MTMNDCNESGSGFVGLGSPRILSGQMSAALAFAPFAGAVETANALRACNNLPMKCADFKRSGCGYSCRIHLAERKLMKT
jgi:hypothetical protein